MPRQPFLDTSQSLALVGGNLVNRNHLRRLEDCGEMYIVCNETTTSFQLRSCLHSILGELLAMVVASYETAALAIALSVVLALATVSL